MVHQTVVHFEIPATNIDKLKSFYAKCFDWKFEKAQIPGMEYWVIRTGPTGETIGGGMYRKAGDGDLPRNYIGVNNIDRAIGKFRSAGGTEVSAKHEIPGEGWSYIGKDPEGNIVGLFQEARKE